MLDEVLFGLIYGNLAQQHIEGDRSLASILGPSPDGDETKWYENIKRIAPGHYVRFLVRSNAGLAATPNELLQATAVMRRYIMADPYVIELGNGADA